MRPWTRNLIAACLAVWMGIFWGQHWKVLTAHAQYSGNAQATPVVGAAGGSSGASASTGLTDTANLARVTTANNFGSNQQQMANAKVTGGSMDGACFGCTTRAAVNGTTGTYTGTVALKGSGYNAFQILPSGTGLQDLEIYDASTNLQAGFGYGYSANAPFGLNVNGMVFIAGYQNSICLAARKGYCDVIIHGGGDGSVTLLSSIGAQGFQQAISTKTSAYTAAATDYTLVCDATTAAATVTLPSSPATGETHIFKKKDASANNCTLSGNGKNIDGGTSIVLTMQYAVAQVQYDGTQWWRLN